MRKKRCPVCGELTTETGNITPLGRVILKCGDAVWPWTDKLGRRSWGTKKQPLKPGKRVHVNTDHEEWGRVASDGTVTEVLENDALVLVDSIRATILVHHSEISPR